MTDNADIHFEVANYYAARLNEHGDTAQGVDWKDSEGQFLRFEQLLKAVDSPGRFSLNDIGCGYGALVDFLTARYVDFLYRGCDISTDMIHAARNRHVTTPNVFFGVGSKPPAVADYSVASGVFNVKLKRDDAEWKRYVEETLDDLSVSCLRGFAFNCLTSYSDRSKMKDHLYYADPCGLFDFCKRRYSRNVALFHDYGLYEFTIIVRKHP